MMIQIDIPDGSPELTELQDCIAGTGITEQQYVENIIIGWLQQRIRNEYAAYVQKLTPGTMKDKLGRLASIKAANRRR